MEGKYDDIIMMPHYVSSKRKHMSATDRAAQFAPFAALTGYEDAVNETARLTEDKVLLDENMNEDLDKELRILNMHISESPEVTVVFFTPDSLKCGGTYSEYRGKLKMIDEYNKALVLMNGERILIDNIITLKCNSSDR